MAKASSAEIARRIEELVALLTDCLTARDIRTYLRAQSDWGAQISEAQLKRYLRRARSQMAEAASIDRRYEMAAAKLRYERTMARAAATGDLPTYLRANRELSQLLGLALPRLPAETPDIEASRRVLAEEIAKEIADHEDHR